MVPVTSPSLFRATISTHLSHTLTFLIRPTPIGPDHLQPVRRSFQESPSETIPTTATAASSSTSTLAFNRGRWKLDMTERRPAKDSKIWVDVKLAWNSGPPVSTFETTNLSQESAPTLAGFDSFRLSTKETLLTLISRNIDRRKDGACIVVEDLDPDYLLDKEGRYAFQIILSTEKVVDSMMPSLANVYPRLFLQPMDFDDPQLKDVAFLFVEDQGRTHKLYAHLCVLHQHQFFCERIPVRTAVGEKARLLPRKFLVRDFSVPLFRAVLGWVYTRVIFVPSYPTHPKHPRDSGSTAAPSLMALRAESRTARENPSHDVPPCLWSICSLDPAQPNYKVDPTDCRYTWMDVYQVAANLKLEELKAMAVEEIVKRVEDRLYALALLTRFGGVYPDLKDALVKF